MFSHVFIGVSDFDKSLAFYNAIFDILGARLRFNDNGKAIWRGKEPRPIFVIGKPANGEKPHPGNGHTCAFSAETRAQVDDVFAKAMMLCGKDEGGPALRPQYHAHYYGAYFRDLDGNKLCVVCHNPA